MEISFTQKKDFAFRTVKQDKFSLKGQKCYATYKDFSTLSTGFYEVLPFSQTFFILTHLILHNLRFLNNNINTN